MKLKDKIEKVIERIEEKTGYRFIGKEFHRGLVYYVFQDQFDYIDYKYYSAQYMREEAKEII